MNLSLESKNGGVIRIKMTGGIGPKKKSPFHDSLKDVLESNVYAQNVSFDLSEVERLETSGIVWLLECHRQFDQHRGKMVLHSIPPNVAKTLNMLRMNHVLKTAATDTDAETALRS